MNASEPRTAQRRGAHTLLWQPQRRGVTPAPSRPPAT